MVAGATDCRQPTTTGDELPAGSAEALACNGTEVKVDVNTETGGFQSSDESGGESVTVMQFLTDC